MKSQSNGFWRKLALYLLPFALALIVLTGGLIYLGESMPLVLVARLQQADDRVLYRPQYGNRDQQFKLISAEMRHAEVLALGSSRILQFRAGFFNRNPDVFYNAAAPAWRLPQVTKLFYALDRESLPRVLILAIDPPWFNEAYAGDEFPKDLGDIENALLADRSFLQDVLAGKDFGRAGFDMSAYVRREEPGQSGGLALGLRAIRDGHGFRSDGSEQYGDFLVAQWLVQEQMRDNHMDWMRQGRDMYVYGDSISESALDELGALLDYAAENGVYVIGYLPSYAPNLWQRMISRGNHTYIEALTPRLETLLTERGFAFFDFSDGASASTRTDEFFDGWHASELGNLRLYMHMLAALPDVLGQYSDYDGLAQIVANATDTWAVFGLGNAVP